MVEEDGAELVDGWGVGLVDYGVVDRADAGARFDARIRVDGEDFVEAGGGVR